MTVRTIHAVEYPRDLLQVISGQGDDPAWTLVVDMDVNGIFGRASGDYVFVVHGLVGEWQSLADHGDVQVIAGARGGGGATYIDTLHQIQFDSAGAGRSPLQGSQHGLPFWIVHRATIAAGQIYELRARAKIPTSAAGFATATGIALVENVVVHAFSLDDLDDAGVDWAFTGSAVSVTAGASGSTVADMPGIGAAVDSTWSCFWSARMSPGGTPAVPLTQDAPSVRVRARRAAATLSEFPWRGYSRRRGAIRDDTARFQLGGIATRTMTNTGDAFGVEAIDPAGVALVDRVDLFALDCTELGVQSYMSPGAPPPAYETYSIRNQDINAQHRLQWVGDSARHRVLFVDVAKADDVDVIGDVAAWTTEPRYPYAEPVGQIRRYGSTRLYALRSRREWTPEYRSAAHIEVQGAMTIETIGSVLESSPASTDPLVHVSDLLVLSIEQMHGVEPPVLPTVETPGPWIFADPIGTALSPGNLPTWPTPPEGSAQITVSDEQIQFIAGSGDSVSWPLQVAPAESWTITFGWSATREPDALDAWRAFLADPDLVAVAWQSPLDSQPLTYLIDPQSLRFPSGPMDGIWRLELRVVQAAWIDPNG